MNDQLKIKPLVYAVLLLFVLPNVAFLLARFWLGFDRSIINIDYILPLLLLSIRKVYFKIIGIAVFAILFFIDILLIILQHFPSFNFKDSFYLLGFIFSGPKIFLVATLMILATFLVTLVFCWVLSNRTTIKNVLIALLLLVMVQGIAYVVDQTHGLDSSPDNTSFGSSGLAYFIKNQETSFMSLLGGDQLIPLPYEHATKLWTKAIDSQSPLNKKIFLIIVESWGEPLDKHIQDDLLKNLKLQAERFDYFKQGDFKFYGLTVEAELRELCQLYPTTVDLYQIKTGFQGCMPHLLNKLGYETQAIHGGNSTIYGRKEWYPKAGFQIRTFQEELNKPVNCIPFDGICDVDILPFIKESFAQDKQIFNYWLTLTTHYEYYEHDLHNRRFNCTAYNIPEGEAACRSFMLLAQFFDQIAELVSSPEMQGVEVIIVGDHPPPLFTATEIALFKDKTDSSKEAKVGWVHFRIKDKIN